MLQSVRHVCAIGALSIFFCAAVLNAQSSLGSIVGIVRDPTGAPIAGARLRITNLETNQQSTYETEANGDYYVPSLIPGAYRVEAEKQGFNKAAVQSVRLAVNQTLRVDLPMTLGQITQQVQVSAAAQMIQTDTSSLGQVITTRQVTDLPLNGRDFTNLLKLNAGVNTVAGGSASAPAIRPHGFNDSYSRVSVNGARPASVSYLVDGVTSNEPLFQAPTAIPPIDAIEEFKIQNALYSAAYGMGAAQVNIAMKSGTNALHGAVWEFLRNDALEPENPRFHTKNPLKQNQFGGALGGPVFLPKLYNGKDRTFFFVSYQGGRRTTSAFSQTQVPTDQEKQGSFSDWPVQLYNPLTGVPNPGGTPAVLRAPFPGNQIPSTLFAPQSVNMLRYFPAPTVNCQLPCENYSKDVVTPLDMDNFTIRIDQSFSEKDRVFGQFLFQNENAPQPSLMPLSGINENERSRNAGLEWTHTFNPRTLNEARIGFNRFYYLQDFETANGSVNYWKQIGLKNLADDPAYYALPNVVLGTQYATLGYGASVPFFNISNLFQYEDDAILTRGRHTIEIGADIRRNQNMNRNGLGGNGTLNFGGAYTARNPLAAQVAGQPNTGNGFADMLLGYLNGGVVARFSAFDQSISNLRNTDYGLYFQDDFRVNDRLTLNLGLRWELHTPFHDKYNGGDIFDFGYPGGRLLYADPSFTKLVNNPIQAACCVSRSLIATDWHDWAPRIGFAWRPFSSSRFVVRSGYGIFYDVLDNFYPTQSVSEDIPYLEPVLPTPTGLENQPPVDIRNLFPAPYSVANRTFPPPYCQAPSKSVVNPATGQVTEVLNQCTNPRVQLPDNRTPYTQQWAFNIQYQLTPAVLVEVGYQGSHGLREPIAWSFNQAFLPPVAGNANNSVSFTSQCPSGSFPSTCSPIQSRVPYSNFAAAATALANIAQSTYHAMTVKVDKRFTGGLQGLGAFTWGKAIDQSSELGGGITGDEERAQYSHNLSAERGLANFNQEFRFVGSFVYDLPFGRGRRYVNHGGILSWIAGGWQANGIITLVSGSPATVLCGCGDRSQTGETRGTERLNAVASPYASGFQQSLTGYFDVHSFSEPSLGTLGNGGRDTVFSTPQHAVDFSLFKNNRVTERLNVQFRAEAFNLFSSHYYTPVFPQNAFTATNFGSLLPPGGDSGNLWNPRIYQLALKVLF